MPPHPPAGDSRQGLPETPIEPPKPTPFGVQMAQLVIIPAVIVVGCIVLALLFGKLAGAKDNIDTHLLKLRQSSGAGKLMLGLQDPRYKDRGLAAYNIATMIPKVTDPQEKQRISNALVEILNQYVSDNELLLQSYLLMALGQLGQEGGFDSILKGTHSKYAQVRQGAIGGILSWPDRETAREALDRLLVLLDDESPIVSAAAGAALGWLAKPEDQRVIVGLQAALEKTAALTYRETRWNTAVALTRLGDPIAGRFVTNVLLNREALSLMPAGESGPRMDQTMPPAMVDRMILSTLASLRVSNNPMVWDKIQQIADNDPNKPIRNAAKQILMHHDPKG